MQASQAIEISLAVVTVLHGRSSSFCFLVPVNFSPDFFEIFYGSINTDFAAIHGVVVGGGDDVETALFEIIDDRWMVIERDVRQSVTVNPVIDAATGISHSSAAGGQTFGCGPFEIAVGQVSVAEDMSNRGPESFEVAAFTKCLQQELFVKEQIANCGYGDFGAGAGFAGIFERYCAGVGLGWGCGEQKYRQAGYYQPRNDIYELHLN